MLATHPPSLSLHSPPASTTRPCPPSSSRTALADSTNISSHSNVCSLTYPKSCVYPTSSARTSCSWSDFQSSVPSVSSSVLPRHHHSFSALSPFPVTCKAPPTVSVSFSAACSQRERLRGSRVQGLEPDFPDVKSFVPFPTTPLDGDADVDMLDGTCGPYSDSQVLQAPRKRHSAQSSVSSSPGNLGKDVKQKRPRKSKRQVVELWWLGVVHRSVLRGIEARQSIGEQEASDRSSSGARDLDAADRILVEKMQRRLAENGCVEGRALPNPLPRISSPSISVPSLNLVAPSRKALETGLAPSARSSELNFDGTGTLDGTATHSSSLRATSHASLSIASPSSTPSSTSMSHRRPHVRFETAQQARQSPLHPGIPRRSPSPPARTGAASGSPQALTLTIPQLVATLTLAHHERSGLRLRGRTYKIAEGGKNAGRSLLSVPFQSVPCSDGDAAFDKENMRESLALARARLSSAPQRKSPLSRVV